MNQRSAISARKIFDGSRWHEDCCVVFENGIVSDIVPAGQLPVNMPLADAGEGMLVPGFVDLQVNGGGGVLLNDEPSVEAIERICVAHRQFGTTALLPTLISDGPDTTALAIKAAQAAYQQKIAGCLGLHLEGPYLSQARRGAHDARYIRVAHEGDIASLVAARAQVANLLVTVAPEAVDPEQVRQLADAGIKVSLGHSDASCANAVALVEAGATLVTHLFNAMSPLGHREPGMVGAALSQGGVSVGLIADGFHVDPIVMGIAIRAKQGPGRIFLVTDAMSTIGSEQTFFTLNGRRISRSGGRLTLEDGTLAGADIDMIASVRFLHDVVGLELDEALRMASLYPAQALGVDKLHGHIGPGGRADFVQLSNALAVERVWVGGTAVFKAD
ncbi:MAG: N-acetylglucosamine-6-phosphate deacetylase [Rhizobiaceae bacterium]|nr:N-acetylglucosamine-6-phosphate deacetylase [Rhizobiaceae bacterium]